MSATLGALHPARPARLDHPHLRAPRRGRPGELEPVEQRRHRSRRPLRAELHAGGADGSVDMAKADQHQRAVPALPPVLGEPRRGRATCPSRDTFINSTPHMTFVRGARQRRLPAQALRGAQGPAAVRRAWSTREDPRGHRRVDAAAHQEAQRQAAHRRDAQTRRAPTSTSARSPVRSSTTSSRTAPSSPSTTRCAASSARRTASGASRCGTRSGTPRTRCTARFVFVGAGGGALHLLQKSGIPEIEGFGGFPISGQFLRTNDPESSPSTRPRSTARPPSARRRCRCRTSTPASSTARPRCCSARTRASAPSS